MDHTNLVISLPLKGDSDTMRRLLSPAVVCSYDRSILLGGTKSLS
jgi:hypothetical protein